MLKVQVAAVADSESPTLLKTVGVRSLPTLRVAGPGGVRCWRSGPGRHSARCRVRLGATLRATWTTDLLRFSDLHGQPTGSRPRSPTDLNGSGCPYGYLRNRRCRPCHIRAIRDGNRRSITATATPSSSAASRIEPFHRVPIGTRHRSSKLVMRVRFPSGAPL